MEKPCVIHEEGHDLSESEAGPATLASCVGYSCDHNKVMETTQYRCDTCGSRVELAQFDLIAHNYILM